jgi:hypothetical protein
MPDLSLDLAEAFEDEGFWFSDRWHTFGTICKNGCHEFKDEDGMWCHVPTLPELIAFVEGRAKVDTLTVLFARRALLKLRNMPPEPHPRRRRRPHGPKAAGTNLPSDGKVIPFPRAP